MRVGFLVVVGCGLFLGSACAVSGGDGPDTGNGTNDGAPGTDVRNGQDTRGTDTGAGADNGIAPDDVPNPPDTTGTSCASLSTCGTCAGIPGCGWCTTTSACLMGDVGGSTDGTCTGASWDFTGDFCPGQPDGGAPDSGAHGGCVPTVARGGENSDALCSDGIDNDCNGYIDCNDFNCSRNPAVTVCSGPGHDGGTVRDGGGCVPSVPRGGENTDTLCSDGIDNDCNGYIDCNDFNCSRNANVTVCGTTRPDGGTGFDASVHDSGPPPPPVDAGPAGPIGPNGGTVSLLRFAAFGDVRPAANNSSIYPVMIISSIMTNFRDLNAEFAVASGDYMFATTASIVHSHVSSLLQAETLYGGQIFHSMGNHECTGATASNCPNGDETPNIQEFMQRINGGHYATPYFDWVIHTSFGDAHFIAASANAWSNAQQSWLQSALAQPATYTFVMAHEPPTGSQGPGSSAIDHLIAARPGGVTLRLYGHTHEYRHITGNEVIDGNAGAPLQGSGGSGDYYGFAMVDQRADGNIVFTAYQVGTPPMAIDSFVVTPAGTPTR